MKATILLVLVNFFLLSQATFSWDNCASGTVQVKSLSVQPDPIVLGANITVAGTVTVSEDITGGSLAITLQKKIFGVWTDIPCVDDAGSCSYSDFCAYLASNNSLCKPPFSNYGIPCQCPVKAGTYSVPSTSVFAKDNGPGWLADGEFYVKAKGTDQNGNPSACIEIYLSISDS